MSLFSKKKDKGKLALVFYIGSSSVGGALFYTSKSGIPKIIFSVHELITLEQNVEADRFLSLTLQTLEVVALRIYKAGLGAPEAIFCVLSSLWYVSQTRIIRLKKNTPFLFTAKLADELIQKEITLFEEEHLEKYLRSGEPIRTIELKTIKTVLNGYETSSPLNQKASELEMTIFISMCGEKILGRIADTIKKQFHSSKEVKFSSFTMSSFAVVRDLYAHRENFLLISVDGEITDISIIKKNVLRESVSFPVGLNSMIRGVAFAFPCSLFEAKSYLSLFKDGHAEESVLTKLGPVMDKLKKEWLLKFQESLSSLSNDISVPANIYLAVEEKEMAGFFSSVIKTEQFNQYTLTESKFDITYLGAEVFHGMAAFEEPVIRDPFLILDSVYINRFLINSGKAL